jgi:membrane dipeptidase
LIADAHNDLLIEVAWREDQGEENPFAEHWLPKLEAGGVTLQVCPLYADLEHLPEGALRVVLKQAAAFVRSVRANRPHVRAVRARGDLDGEGIGLLLSMEGAEPFGSTPALVDAFWEVGVRMASLTWNRRNAFADGAAERAGLSEIGRELVDRLVDLGIVLDVAHASEATFWEMLERSGRAPVVASHSCCRAVCDTPRNLSDDQLRAIAERGGVVGMMALPLVVDPARPTIERFVDHLDHAVAVAGWEHVGLGGDFIAQLFASGAARISPRDQTLLPPGLTIDQPLEGLAGPEDYGALVAALRARGYDGERLDGILRGNLVRVLREALPV